MEAKPKVLILYTGGTIGMIEDSETTELTSMDFDHIERSVPELKQLNVQLESKSFENPIDSSEMGIEHWKEIAQTVFEIYSQYDGFVILHGTDTMAYTASALSYMFSGLKKPIILTGSQLPIGRIRTDGKENLITAIEIAAAKDENDEAIIQEVAIYFDSTLLRGNRCTKESTDNFKAFSSPNYRPLGNVGVEIKYYFNKLYRSSRAQLELDSDLSNKIAHVKLYPGINFELYKTVFDHDQVDGVVLETFGAGNAPSDIQFSKMLAKFIEEGGIVLNITQCITGKVKQGRYTTSSLFNKIGVISGGDMTTEAAITKMMFALNHQNKNNVHKLLSKDLRGEVTHS